MSACVFVLELGSWDSGQPSPLWPFQEAALHPLSSRALPLHFQTDVFLQLVMAETVDPKAS